MEFSFIICTYNPQERLLKRALQSCMHQNFTADQYEVILVDNHSTVPVNQWPLVQNFQSSKVSLQVVREEQPGLAFARIKGTRIAQSKVLVFVDDDNELDVEYLSQLSTLCKEHPRVAIWGPGNIQPDYVDGAPEWIKKYFGYLYQEKSLSSTKFTCEKAWPSHYPAGSGMVVSKEMMTLYAREFESGLLSATGRKGNSLASGEDSQIVWTAVKHDCFVGTSPRLKLIHIIPGNRTTLEYLIKLNYGISYSYYCSLCEMFPEQQTTLHSRTIKNRLGLLYRVISNYFMQPGVMLKKFKIENAWFKGYDDCLKQLTTTLQNADIKK